MLHKNLHVLRQHFADVIDIVPSTLLSILLSIADKIAHINSIFYLLSLDRFIFRLDADSFQMRRAQKNQKWKSICHTQSKQIASFRKHIYFGRIKQWCLTDLKIIQMTKAIYVYSP